MTWEYDQSIRPDEHLDPATAAVYDQAHLDRFSETELDPTVDFLAELAGDGPAVEFAVGTGRVALPLSQRGITVHGIDFSEPMLDQLRAKPGADQLNITHGDMTSTVVGGDFALAYLVFNTIGNLRTQQLQVDCFRNAAAHLRPGGHFVVEVELPKLASLPPGQTVIPYDVSDEHLGFDEYADRLNQILISHHYYIDGDRVRRLAGAFRYVWPSELDLMAQLAGMSLVDRWSDWKRTPFTDESTRHVSVWRLEPVTRVTD